MQIPQDHYDDEPVRGDLRLLLLLVALCPLGLLIWVELFLAVRWSLLSVWAAV